MKTKEYQPHRFSYEWKIKDGYPAKGIKKNNCKVFGTFICGGGSTMGYKLAGFEHLGGVEIDPKVSATYKANHNPKYLYTEDLRDFNSREDLPKELFNLDILDGSPPCSTFSMAGQRDKAWGKEKKFSEGQKVQTLDDLVFIYCDTILKLKPKCFILENVSGIIKGNAKSYSKRIVEYLTKNGYIVQVFMLDSSTMGVPQKRQRVFFIGHRKEFILPKLNLNFNEKPILFGEIEDKSDTEENLSPKQKYLWSLRRSEDNDLSGPCLRNTGKMSFFSHVFAKEKSVLPTITAGPDTIIYDIPRTANDRELKLASSFPLDYVVLNKDTRWYVGMSVPPIMIAQISYQIYNQWLRRIK